MHLRAALLEREQLFGAEGLVVDLRGRLDEVLQVRAGEEVAQVDEFAVPFVFDVDGAPAVLAAAHGLAVDGDAALGADDGEGDDGLRTASAAREGSGRDAGGLTLICAFMAASSLSYSSFS